jgi:colanic acid/amylovoran biosynthesis glycosyltransferase
MRKVLFFKETLLPPSETFILGQVTALSGYEPTLAGLERTRPSLSLPHKPLLLSDRVPAISSLKAKVYRRTGIAPFFHRKVKRLRPDLIHAHFAGCGRAALPLARALRVPLLVTLYGADVTVRKPHEIYKRLGEEAKLFLCVSGFLRDRALDAGFPSQKLFVHHLGVDRSLFCPLPSPETPRGVLFVGRLVEKKGCEYLLRAMKLVQRAHPESELTVIGDGPLRLSLEALARQLNIRCRFRGVQPAAIIREALHKTRVFCAPSVTAANGDTEGLPVVLGESLATGVPAVSTTHAGIPEMVVDGVTGLLVPERDSRALSEALCRLIEDDDLWQSFHRAGPQRIEQHWDVNKLAAKMEGIYDGIIAAE